jgi:hypothetical protein
MAQCTHAELCNHGFQVVLILAAVTSANNSLSVVICRYYMHGFRMIVRINRDSFPEQYSTVGLIIIWVSYDVVTRSLNII